MQGLLAGRKNIIAANINRQFVGSVVEINTTLEKGLVDEFKYGDAKNIIQIKKTGKDLKAALEREKQRQETVCTTLLVKMAACVKQIDVDPTVDNSNWRTEKYPNLPAQPKSYDTYASRETMTDNYVSKEDCDATCKVMYEYNNYCYNYCDACIQVAMLTTLVNNVEEKKTYPLNVELATMLGF